MYPDYQNQQNNSQPGYGAIQPGNSQYDFIMNQGAGKRSGSRLPGGGSSLMSRLIIAIGGLVVLVVAVVIFSIFLTRGGKELASSLLSVAQTQQEVQRIAEIGLQASRSNDVKAAAITTQFTIMSDQSQLLANMKKIHNIKTTPKDLALKANKKTDTQLTEAANANRYDQTFKGIMVDALTAYRTSLSTAFAKTKNANDKTVLNKAFQNTDLLLKMFEVGQ